MNDLRKFNKIFRKDVTFDKKTLKKSLKNQGFTLSLEDTFLKKLQGGGQVDIPPPLPFKG